MKISFHGANKNVTGSCHLIECAGKRILIDCGLYQGSRELMEDNAGDFGFDPASIDFLCLTHAHLDHCGRIPLLVKRGFTGEIISTAASVELARLVMLDSAGLQEEEARYQQRKAARRNRNHHKDIEPLYTTLDALNSLGYFGRSAHYGETLELAPGIKVRFIDAGHILGSASLYFELTENQQHKRVMFSGDLGYSNRAILRNPDQPEVADVVIMETTYGDRLHKQLQPSIEELYHAVNQTIERGGNVIIPSFALERAQEILYYLREGVENRKINQYVNVFLDSPMAISATEIFKRHPECFDDATCHIKRNGNDPFHLPGLHFTRESSESMAINQLGGGAVIMAGSGMCTGGRVRHHLRYNLWGRKNSVIFVGYAARGTLARQIIDGAKRVKIFGEDISVNADIYTIGGFSAHADQAELMKWHQKTGSPEVTYLVHGEEKSMHAFANKLAKHKTIVPELHQAFTL